MRAFVLEKKPLESDFETLGKIRTNLSKLNVVMNCVRNNATVKVTRSFDLALAQPKISNIINTSYKDEI